MQPLAVFVFVALLAANSSNALPTNQQRFDRETTSSSDRPHNIVGVASNVLAAEVLRSNANANKNFVFSPIGFSSILAILAEGARGETAARLSSALQHPADSEKGMSLYIMIYMFYNLILICCCSSQRLQNCSRSIARQQCPCGASVQNVAVHLSQQQRSRRLPEHVAHGLPCGSEGYRPLRYRWLGRR